MVADFVKPSKKATEILQQVEGGKKEGARKHIHTQEDSSTKHMHDKASCGKSFKNQTHLKFKMGTVLYCAWAL